MNYEKSLKEVPLFSNLDDLELKNLANFVYPKSFSKGEIIFRQSDPGKYFFLVKKGKIKITSSSEEGQEVTLAIIEEKECFGEMSLLDEEKRSAAAVALSDSEILYIPTDAFLKFLNQSPQVAIKLLAVLSRRLRRADEKIESLVFHSAKERLLRLLLEWIDTHGENVRGTIYIKQPLTHQEIANLLGTTRETITRIFNELRQKNIISIEGKKISIIEKDKVSRVLEHF